MRRAEHEGETLSSQERECLQLCSVEKNSSNFNWSQKCAALFLITFFFWVDTLDIFGRRRHTLANLLPLRYVLSARRFPSLNLYSPSLSLSLSLSLSQQ